MEYSVKKCPVAPPAGAKWDGEFWGDVPGLRVDQFRPEGSDHRPVVEAKLAHSQNALHVFFRVQDRYVRCVAENLNDRVCQDSCVELFIQPPGRDEYVSIEINGGGTMMSCFVEDPYRPNTDVSVAKFTRITPEQAAKIAIEASLPRIVEPEITDPTEWTVRYTVPIAFFEKFFSLGVGPLGGQTWRANLYKCGDKTSHPHWASWASIGEKFDFHQPAFFAPLHFEP